MKSLIFPIILTVFALQACGKEEIFPCPQADEQFIQSSLDAYFKKHPRPGIKPVIDGRSHYDTSTNWWIVPLKGSDGNIQALLSCDGFIEITGR